MCAIDPVAVAGPVIDKNSARHSTSIDLIQKMLSRGVPALPHLQLGFVDVRDVYSAGDCTGLDEQYSKGFTKPLIYGYVCVMLFHLKLHFASPSRRT